MATTAVRRNGPDQKKDAWLSIEQARKLLGMARHTLLARTLDGDFETAVFGGRRFISRASVERALGEG
jgi:hypothetical protein